MKGMFEEPTRDPRLGDALRRIEPPDPGRDDAALARRIVVAAGPRLARLRGPAPAWWEWTAAWARFAVPAGLVASLIGAALLTSHDASLDRLETDADTVTVSSTLLAAAAVPAGEIRVADRIVAPASDTWLLEAALTR